MQWLNLEWIDAWGAATVAHLQRLQEAPPSAGAAAAAADVNTRQSELEEKKETKRRDATVEQNLKIWSLSSHSWEFVDLTWCLTGRLLIISICLHSPLLHEIVYKDFLSAKIPHKFCSPLTKCGNLRSKPNAECFCGLVLSGRDPLRSLLAWWDISLLVWKGTGSFP